MKVVFVVQRYSPDLSGGAELHCRWVAEHMSRHWDVEVLTTRAADYITWKNAYPGGVEIVNGVPVRRFAVRRPRDPARFGRIQERILYGEHKAEDELRWLEDEGPLVPALLGHIRRTRREVDYYIFFSYRYYHSYWGVNTVPDQSVLVPTAEHDPVIHLRLFKDLFRRPRAFIYNSVEERDMIQRLSANHAVPGLVTGVGTEVPSDCRPGRFRRKHGLSGPYLVYIGRVDRNKGCHKLFDFFLRFKSLTASDVKLVLIGGTVLPIPHHPDIHYLGILSEQDKFDGLAGAELLLMPSFYESLSMVTLEAWALGKPVLANAHCEVLAGQCRRSNGGLYYRNYAEFHEALDLLLADAPLRQALGRNGRRYYDAHYTWEVIEGKYLSVISQLEEENRCRSINSPRP